MDGYMALVQTETFCAAKSSQFVSSATIREIFLAAQTDSGECVSAKSRLTVYPAIVVVPDLNNEHLRQADAFPRDGIRMWFGLYIERKKLISLHRDYIDRPEMTDITENVVSLFEQPGTGDEFGTISDILSIVHLDFG
jgi:hypothetical protein